MILTFSVVNYENTVIWNATKENAVVFMKKSGTTVGGHRNLLLTIFQSVDDA
jgi:hypothetical protein